MAVSMIHTKGMACYHRGSSSRPGAVQRPTTQSRTPVQTGTFTGSRIQQPLLYPRHQQEQRSVLCRGLFGLGLPEIAVIAGVAALIFGPSKLPDLGKGLGKTVKSFQTAAKEFKSELEAAATADDEPASAKTPGAAAGKQDEPAKKE